MVHRIDDPTAVAVMPAPRAQGTPGYFTGGSPGSGGFAATVVRYEFMNMLQEELAAVVLAAGLVLDKTDNNQLFEALQKLARLKLFQDITLYVSTTGSDSNDGLTAGTAFRTGQAAWNKAITLDLNGHSITIQFANGTYTDPIICSGSVQGIVTTNGVIFQGNTGAPDQVVLNVTNASCVTATNGAAITVRGMTLRATGMFDDVNLIGIALLAEGASSITFDHMVFGACDSVHIACYGSTVASATAPYTISGGAQYHIAAFNAGTVGIQRSPVSIVGNPVFSKIFAHAIGTAVIYAVGASFAGAATGVRYGAELNAVHLTTPTGGTSNPNFYPGNAAGSVSSGGQYV